MVADNVPSRNELGVIQAWNSDSESAHYGFLTPFRRTRLDNCFWYFDRTRLTDPSAQLKNGGLANFIIQSQSGKNWVSSVCLVNFEMPVAQLDFVPDDFAFWRNMASRMQNPRKPLTKYIHDQADDDLKETLSRYHGSGFQSQLPMMLCRLLNKVISGHLIHTLERFEKVKLRSQTKSFLENPPHGGELRYLNRLLLEDAFAKDFANLIPDCSPAYAAGVVFMQDEANRKGLLHSSEGLAEFNFDGFSDDSKIPSAGKEVKCRITEGLFGRLFAYDIQEITAEEKTKLPQLWNPKTSLANPSNPDTGQINDLVMGWKLRSKNQQPAILNATPTPPSNKPTRVDYKKTIASDDRSTKPTRITSDFKFDHTAGAIVFPNGKSRKIPTRLAGVLAALFKQKPGTTALTSELSYKEIAKEFQIGEMLEEEIKNGGSQSKRGDLERKLLSKWKLNVPSETSLKATANNWRKAIGEFLTDDCNIEPSAAFKVKKDWGYRLGPGWHHQKMAKGDSEVPLIGDRF